MERGGSRAAERRGRDEEEDDDRTGEDNGRDGEQETGPIISGKHQRRQGGEPLEVRPWGDRRREQGVERRERRGFGGVRDGGGRYDRRGSGGERKHADSVAMGHARKRRGRSIG